MVLAASEREICSTCEQKEIKGNPFLFIYLLKYPFQFLWVFFFELAKILQLLQRDSSIHNV